MMLMGLCDQILNLEAPLEEYAQFFTSADSNESETTNFAVDLKHMHFRYQSLPRNGSNTPKIIFLTPKIL